ncbi:trypsin-like peptidase domain-containing protein [[Micrococcus luteus] ATCC 49442]|uniref:trypsin-like peptidase domain-containing protein n=1 Tax=[Micrococcus luteus] ATCC 49442 TaxID=2698727 RepID=UPI001FCB712C|nr:effector-associated domain EAD1-containing protein [[Micrococcus luteus] ATCC 49442]
MNWMKLSGSQQQRFDAALLDLFDLESLQRLLTYRLDVSMWDIVGRGPAQQVVYDLVRTAQKQGWMGDLLLAASEARLGYPELEALKTELNLGKSTTADSNRALEAFVLGLGALLDPAVLRVKLAKAEAAVCRISYPLTGGFTSGGTGFLVGPDVVMTNYHVMKSVIEGQVSPAAVSVLFDYKLDGGGQELNAGTPFGLANPWLVDYSRYSATDVQPHPNVPDTPADELDYAIVRLDHRVGCQPVPTNVPGNAARGSADGDSPRGWIPLPVDQPVIAPPSSLLILQHPQIGMMKLSWPPADVLAVNGTGTRIRHASATLPGSSGSPCFDASFNVVALHHAGDPAQTATIPATYNQAIPMKAILGLLETRGLDGILGEQCP